MCLSDHIVLFCYLHRLMFYSIFYVLFIFMFLVLIMLQLSFNAICVTISMSFLLKLCYMYRLICIGTLFLHILTFKYIDL